MATWPENDEERTAFADWQYEVANGDTHQGFRDWMAARTPGDNTAEACRAPFGVTRLYSTAEAAAEAREEGNHPRHTNCADGCGLAVTHTAGCRTKPGGPIICGPSEHEGCDTCGAILPGVIEAMDSDEGIQRCDTCDLYAGDLEAAKALADHVGGTVWFLLDLGDSRDPEPRQWDGSDLPIGSIAGQTNPWVEVDGVAVNWPEWKAANT